MRLRDLFRRNKGTGQDPEQFECIADEEGLNFVLPPKSFAACQRGEASEWLLFQYANLQILEEQEEATRIRNGFVVATDRATRLDEVAREVFNLPSPFPSRFRVRVEGLTTQNAFRIELILVLPDGKELWHYDRKGPLLRLTRFEEYLLRPFELEALLALEAHEHTPGGDTEARNLALVSALQRSKEGGMDVDLSHFNHLQVRQPEAVGVAVQQESNGDLTLSPTYGTAAPPDDIPTRIHQVDVNKEVDVLRVRDEIVVLDKKRLDATREILTNKRIPRERVRDFLQAPTAFLDAELVDLEMGFSVRVKGAERFVYYPLGETDRTGIGWFDGDVFGDEQQPHPPAALYSSIQSEEDLRRFEALLDKAQRTGVDAVVFDGATIDISDVEAIQAILKDLQAASFGAADDQPIAAEKPDRDGAMASIALDDPEVEDTPLPVAEPVLYPGVLDFSVYKRQPYAHQEEGIRWLYNLLKQAVDAEPEMHRSRVQGALLADDMGLGKTYTALVCMDLYYRMLRESGSTCKPILVVAPLSLLENWQEEAEQTFSTLPFEDVVFLQGQGLQQFKIAGQGPETRQQVDEGEILEPSAIRYALKVGQRQPGRLDMPARLVLTTYQTLRNYQFSMCLVDWGMVVFDEAQNIKSPNALQTRAAKGLKADFKLLTTGTPVENSLADFWCLMDTAQPGLLESWPAFREKYVRPINADKGSHPTRIRVGTQLRRDTGNFMLRRLKEDQLDNLPSKHIYTGVSHEEQDAWIYLPELKRLMSGVQLDEYNQVLTEYKRSQSFGSLQGQALVLLTKLRAISLCPALSQGTISIGAEADEARRYAAASAKLQGVLSILDQVNAKQEKVIIFLINKQLQARLKIWIERIYKIKVHVVNGSTNPRPSRSGKLSRKGLIDDFEARPGFGVIIMSPRAAGVGLTVVGANHVIHLERHWNPATEAQATDRAYRIGQQKDVHVYLPIAHHPNVTSFDVNLDRLLRQKVSLKDAVMTPQEVDLNDLYYTTFESP